MVSPLRRRRRTRSLFLFLMMLALVATQGMRLCLHTDDAIALTSVFTPAFTAAFNGSADSGLHLHLEGDLMAPEIGADESGDQHFNVGLGMLKQIAEGALPAILVAVALILLLPLPTGRVPLPAPIFIPRSAESRRRPPSRAPPR